MLFLYFHLEYINLLTVSYRFIKITVFCGANLFKYPHSTTLANKVASVPGLGKKGDFLGGALWLKCEGASTMVRLWQHLIGIHFQDF